jgi:hypothetical protein
VDARLPTVAGRERRRQGHALELLVPVLRRTPPELMGDRQDHTPVTDDQRDQFLEQLAAGRSIVDAAGNESLRRKLYRLKEADPQFAAEWARAYQEGTDVLLAEARRRAVEGVDEPKMLGHGDTAQLITITRYSDPLLMFLIKQRDPSYRDNHKIEVTGKDDGPVQIEHRGVKLSDILTAAREVGLSD